MMRKCEVFGIRSAKSYTYGRRLASVPFLSIFILCFLAIFMSNNPSLAQEKAPGDACTTAGLFSRSGGPEIAGAGYFLVCDGANWQRAIEYDDDANLGVQQPDPKAPLHVGGEIILGVTTGLACDSDREGGIRYNTTSNSLELCDGASWAAVSVGACGDATPDALSFTDLVNQATSTLLTSNIDQVTGLSCTVSVSISGSGSPQFRTCSDSSCSSVVIDWTTSGTVSNNEYIQMRLTSSNLDGTNLTAFLNVSTLSTQWSVSTTPANCAGTPLPGAVCADGTIYAGQSGASTNMYVTRCDVGQTWNGSACTGTRSSLDWNNGNNSGFVQTLTTSPVDGSGNTATLDGLDSDSDIGGTQAHQAAQNCADLSQDGHTDWYLPAGDETLTIYNNRIAIGNFDTSGTSYWSSTEGAAHLAHSRNFNTGANNSFQGKGSNLAVRCARRD